MRPTCVQFHTDSLLKVAFFGLGQGHPSSRIWTKTTHRPNHPNLGPKHDKTRVFATPCVNQRKGQNEKFMNFAHFCVNSGVFPWENERDSHRTFVPECGLSSAVKQRGRERKLPEIIQKFCLRKWPISSADFPMTPTERTEHHFGPFWEKDFGAISGGPFFSRPLCFTADFFGLVCRDDS